LTHGEERSEVSLTGPSSLCPNSGSLINDVRNNEITKGDTIVRHIPPDMRGSYPSGGCADSSSAQFADVSQRIRPRKLSGEASLE
jgi:hypothetical protein